MNKDQLQAFRKAKAIEKANKDKWVKHFGEIPDTSGIYILTREENGFKYAYIGQAKNILTRLAQHLKGHDQHIDNSLYKRGLYSEKNLGGWKLVVYALCREDELNEVEQQYIKQYADGYQLYNKTMGSQGIGKAVFGEQDRIGYRKGLHKGYENARRDVAKLFKKNLTFAINGKTGVNKEKALEKFKQFIQIDE